MAKKPKNTADDVAVENDEVEESDENDDSEQGTLFEVLGEDAERILPIAKEYLAASRGAKKYDEKAKGLAETLRDIIDGSDIQRNSDGSCKFMVDGIEIHVTPRKTGLLVYGPGDRKRGRPSKNPEAG